MTETPPEHLSEPLSLDPSCWSPQDIYYLNAALIVPRPIAWVSTLSSDGVANIGPHSYFNGISDDPPYVMFSIEGETDTYANLRDIPECTISFVTEDLASAMELSAVKFPSDEDEFEWADLEKLESECVRPARPKSAKACLECLVDRIIDVGNVNHMIILKVVHYHVSPEIWDKGRINMETYRPIGRLGGQYTKMGSRFKQRRPTWIEIRNANSTGVKQSVEVTSCD